MSSLDPELLSLGARLHTLLDFQFTGTARTSDLRARLGELLGLDPVEEEGDIGEAAWTACLQDLIDQAGVDEFKEKARELLTVPAFEQPTLVVGPVVGKVTETCVRLLVESSHEVEITCTLEAEDSDPVSETTALPQRKPQVICFSDLAPGTLYKVSFEGVDVLVDSCSFRTVPEGGWQLGDGAAPNFMSASCNSVYTSRQAPHDSPGNLWQDLATRMKDGTQIDYMLHMGDNVYNDIEWCKVEKGKMELSGFECKWGIAFEWLKDMPPEEWPDKSQDIEELFRTVYRETWGYPPQRWVLANAPNIMIFDDHDIRDDWGDREIDLDDESLDKFLATIAYRLVNEYQRQLYEDLTEEDPACSYHFHAFGDVGFVFLDLRACKTFHKQPVDEAAPMLGNDQWRALEDALHAEGGLLTGCKAILVLSPEPVAYVTPKPTSVAGEHVVDDLLGQWSAPRHLAEVPRLLKSLLAWRAQDPARAVLLLGGDVHEGGWTDITQEDGEQHIRQLTTSAIANTMTKSHEALAVVMTRDVAGLVDGWKICAGWGFLHYNWTNRRNYAVLDVKMEDDKATIGGYLVASDGEEVEVLERRTTNDEIKSGYSARLGQVKDAFCEHASGVQDFACQQAKEQMEAAKNMFGKMFG
mmetsp:Transcript_70553/g.178624  ORF Transcript_70553/g.178624 Transcript_70553/m.178624 type:complete len:640 (+) Transcript_70553:62-1981(+)